MKTGLVFLCFIFCCHLHAQYIDLTWAKAMQGSNNLYSATGHSVVTDINGNVYTAGVFANTVDFDPGPQRFDLTAIGSTDVFICKLDSSGNFIWAKQFGAISGQVKSSISIAIDVNGNLLIAGSFTGWSDFDPGPAVHELFALATDLFFTNLDLSGNFIWAKQIGDVDMEFLHSMHLDNNGNIYLTGEFAGWFTDWDPGPGRYSTPSDGSGDVFIVKLNNGGNFIWAKLIGGTRQDIGNAVATDNNGNVFIAGQFRGTVDFDPGPGTFTMTATDYWDTFIMKLDISGNFSWAKEFTGLGTNSYRNRVTSITVDGGGNLYTTGEFENYVDFDPGPGVFNLYAINQNVFISMLDASGNFIRAKQLGAANGTFWYPSITRGTTGSLYLTGKFSNLADFDPGSGNYTLRSIGGFDVFVVKLDKTGNFIAAKQMGGTASPSGTSIAVGRDSSIYISGFFNNSMDFNPCVGSNVITAVTTDAFTAKLKVKIPAVTVTATSSSIVCGTSVTFNAIPINCGPAPVYQWLLNGNTVGTNSPVYTVTNLANGDTVKVIIAPSPCYIISPVASNKITMTVVPSGIASASIVASKTTICSGDPVTFTATPVNGGPAPVYNWQVNGINTGNNSPVYTSNSFTNGDIIRVLITSSDACIAPGSSPSNSITVNVSPQLTPAVTIAVFPKDICYGTLATFVATPLNGGNNPVFTWRVNDTVSGTNKASFVTNKLYDGDVVDCILTSNAACLTNPDDTSNSILIKIDPAVCPIGFFMPTAFTPNNDGKNDWCKPLLYGKVIAYNFSLYNRWGQKVFETTDLQKGWDGRIEGSDQSTGIFIWMCRFQFSNQAPEFKKGTVVLIR